MLATSCDKTLATTAAFTSIRVVCQNTLSFAMKEVEGKQLRHLKIQHTKHFDPDRVKKELGLIDSAWDAFLASVRRMAEVPMTRDEAGTFFGQLLELREGELLSPRAEGEHNSLEALFTSAPGQDLATASETLWGAINAVTYYVDHVRGRTCEQRLDSAWFGAGNKLKERAWDLATEISA